MIIRVFNFFFALILSLDVKQGLRWIRRVSLKSRKNKQEEREVSLPLRKDWNRLNSMKKFIQLGDKSILLDHASVVELQRCKLPSSDWANTCAATMVVMAVLTLTSRTFSAADSYSWYSLFVIATCCTIQQLNIEVNLFSILQDVQVLIFRLLPFRVISRLWGRMCNLYITSALRPLVYNFYIKLYNVQLDDALVTDLTHYKTVGAFFCRKLKRELRPISDLAQIVSPVDGKVISFGTLFDGTVHQVKGINYSVNKFLGPCENASNDVSLQNYMRCLITNPVDNDLYSCVIYLAAGDYHRFHSPAQWKMMHRRHFAGDLLSVNPFFLSWLPDLFVLNERVVMSGEWEHGFFSMTAVGATNVGSIVLHDDESLHTNIPYAVKETFSDKSFPDPGVTYTKGSEVGLFKLGSTIVLIFEAPRNSIFCHKVGTKIKYGEKLLMPG